MVDVYLEPVESVETAKELIGSSEPAKSGRLVNNPSVKRWVPYLAKALVLVAALFVVSKFAPAFPPLVVAIIWAAMSSAASIGITYLVVVKRTHNQVKYREGGWRAKLNEGRLLPLSLSFVGAAVLMAGLFFEMSEWGFLEWSLVLAAVFLFIFVSFVVGRVEKSEWETFFQTSTIVSRSSFWLGLVLCAFYFAIVSLEPSVAPVSATDAFLNAPQPFEDSPVALLSEAGKLNALIDGMTTYGLSVAAEASPWWYYLLRAIIAASSLFGLASLLGTCSIGFSELKRVFLPLESAKHSSETAPVVSRFVVEAVALPLALMVVFMFANAQVARVAETGELTWAEKVVRDQVSFIAAYIDEEYYDPEAVQDLIDESTEKYEILTADTKETLIAVVNDTCDAQLGNVDSYLDWYYSLTADYERLAQFFTGTIEDGMRRQLEERLNEGVDDSRFDEVLSDFEEQVDAIKQDLLAGLEDAEIKDVPEWLIVGKDAFDISSLTEPPAPTKELLSSGGRMLASAGIGAANGVVIGKVTAKVLQKEFFSKMAEKLASALARKGLISGAMSAAGTLVAPGVGTAAGIGVGVLSDYLLVKADEALNRETYKQEIIDAIEASRAEMTAEIQGQ
ncbi:hypothetical protein GMI70_05760 [Eggerthellaceae bacterium zg-893]|nr:hypothetical protein [Eggerthellaceae bacterium zg-893]